MTEQLTDVDVLVVGGGPAGLAAALVLGRARRSVLVVDAGEPRNGLAQAVQGLLTRDGTPPGELLACARAEVARYGVRVVSGTVDRVEREGGAVRAHADDGGSWTTRHLVLATGVSDALPPVHGLRERWGRDVLHCPYCHGWEVQDRAMLLLGERAHDGEKALLLRQWSADVTLLLPDPACVPEPDRDRLQARGVRVEQGRAVHVLVEEDALCGVALDDGRSLPADVVWVSPQPVPRVSLALSLGAATEGLHDVAVDACGRTTAPGVWVVGTAEEHTDQVVDAASAGNRAAIALNHELVVQDADAAQAGSC